MSDWNRVPLLILLCGIAIVVVVFKPDHRTADLESQLSFQKQLVKGLEAKADAQQHLIAAQQDLLAERSKMIDALNLRCGPSTRTRASDNVDITASGF
jgi:uncharacterized coiled-coil protein SlyX